MKFVQRFKTTFIAVVCTLLLVGCGSVIAESPDDIVNSIVGKQNETYVKNQPPPMYDYSAPRDVMIQLYNITTPNLADTWTVFYAFGTPIDSCHSRGFPLPYGVSLTSPEYMKTDGNGGDSATSVNLPQPEPNGLYTNGVTTSATWVLCDFGNGGFEPVYVEFDAITYMHPVEVEDGKIIHKAGVPSAVIDLSRAGASTELDSNTSSQDK